MKPRPKNSNVTHGHPSCANYGCKREECLTARRRAMKQREVLRLGGRPCRTTTERTASHIARLRAAGMRDAEIWKTAGVCSDTFYKAARPGGPTTSSTEQKILAIPVPAAIAHSENLARIDGRSTALRLQALIANGWPLTVISAQMNGAPGPGLLSSTMLRIQRDGGHLSLAMAVKVQAAYERLWDKNPLEYGVTEYAASRARAKAAAAKWRRPMDLDDDQLDDPAGSRVIDISPRKLRRPRLRVIDDRAA